MEKEKCMEGTDYILHFHGSNINLV